MFTVGDLGRRVTERRCKLGLTSEELASRAGMNPVYVRGVESSPSAQLPLTALMRLAAALDTSVDDLSGGGMEAPPGRSSPTSRPKLESLSADESKAMVAPGGVGRFVFWDDRGPVALPVNYQVLDGDIVFRTESDAACLTNLEDEAVSFEVDHLDEALTEGWSVLLTGTSRVMADLAELEQARSLDIGPWVGGDRDTFVRLIPQVVTGRRIRHRSSSE
jgi:nitroimidazol reductase NimA-like FMN-containing flavoprotein (pyridoxamine 5'-phosphate oxidase superfamily)